MNWYIGQDIVCVKTHSLELVKEGQTFTIKGLSEGFCKCYKTLINVGISNPQPQGFMHCHICQNNYQTHGVAWFGEILFAPLDSIEGVSEILEIAEHAQPFEI